MIYRGSCHCGNIAFEVEGDIDSLMECNCSICTKKGYLLWFAPQEKLTMRGTPSGLRAYTFGAETVTHHFCARCGCSPLGLGADGNGKAMAAINVRCLDNLDFSQFKINPFDGRAL